MGDLTVIEGVVALGFLVFIGWLTWMTRRTKRFRAGVFVEREYDKKEEEE